MTKATMVAVSVAMLGCDDGWQNRVYDAANSSPTAAEHGSARVSRQEMAVRAATGADRVEMGAGGGIPYFQCDRHDSVINSHAFVAHRQGARIEGVVCCGWLKGCTVRF